MLNVVSQKFSRVVFVAAALLCSYFAAAQKDSPHSGPVMNYHRISESLLTGGHLLDGGTAILQQQGVTVVIDLRDDSPSSEKARFTAAGIEWINVPIEWRNPKLADFDRFSEAMRAHRGDHVLVQCAANYRASAMTYLYRVIVAKVPEGNARKDMDAVWNPNEYETWQKYLADVKETHKE